MRFNKKRSVIADLKRRLHRVQEILAHRCSWALLVTTLVVTIGLFVVPTRAQTPITYDLTASETLGDTLWTIPIGGPMNPSMDGRRFLLRHSDGLFYMVDQATGAYRQVTSAFRYKEEESRNFVFTRVVTDEALTRLFLTVKAEGPDYVNASRTLVIDLEADTIIMDTNTSMITIRHISPVLGRAADYYNVWEFPSMKRVQQTTNPEGSIPWFDDAHGILYRATKYGVQACDPNTGQIVRSYGVAHNEESIVRRPPGSSWIYLITQRVVEGEMNYVIAFHAETGEKRIFQAFAMEDQVAVKAVEGHAIGFAGQKLVMGARIDFSRPNPVWLFDAEAGHSELLIDPPLSPRYIIAPSLGSYTHSSNVTGEDGILRHLTRHRRLVPIGTTSSGDPNEGTGGVQTFPVWLRQTDGELVVTVPPGRTATALTVVTVDGRTVVERRGAELTPETVVSIASWPAGTYLCRLDLGTVALTHSINIAR